MAQSLSDTGGIKMKKYTITVNGTVYDVTVEEGGAGTAQQYGSSSEGSTEGSSGSSTESSSGSSRRWQRKSNCFCTG